MEPRKQVRPKRVRFEKPDGGYRLIRVLELVMAWWLYIEGHIRFRDLRAFFACHELAETRRTIGVGRVPKYRVAELQRLLGGKGGSGLRSSIRRLEKVGLARWGRGGVSFATSPDELRVEDLSGFWEMLGRIENSRRPVPVPRRTLRLLAGGARRVVVATVLAHLFRCVYGNREGVAFDGWCKASWVARTFRVSESKVKEARSHLQAIGWLRVASGAPQWCLNRLGASVTVNHAWRQNGAEFSTADSGPLDAETATDSGPPDSNQNPPTESYKNQNPAPASGSRLVSSKDELSKPELRNVRVEDLKSTDRLLRLFDQATKRGMIDGGELSRLNFVAAAEHALVIGSSNPCGLFVWNVRHSFPHISNSDEDAAHRRLKEYLYGTPEARSGTSMGPAVSTSPALSADAYFVRALRSTLRARGFQQDVFMYVHRERPEWTRERWDKAVLELQNCELLARRSSQVVEEELADAC